MLRRNYLLFAGLISALFSQPALTAENWDLCRIPSFDYIDAEDISGAETRVKAQTVASESDTTIRLTGDVSVTRVNLKINADNVLLNTSTEEIFASGNVKLESPNFR